MIILQNLTNLLIQDSNIDFVTKGGVNSVGITSGGINYQINDAVVFDPNVESSSRCKS